MFVQHEEKTHVIFCAYVDPIQNLGLLTSPISPTKIARKMDTSTESDIKNNPYRILQHPLQVYLTRKFRKVNSFSKFGFV